MKIGYSFFIGATFLTIITSSLFAQLDISSYTNKKQYSYGEKIELYCKITNNADTLFQFSAGSYGSCQAEFSFNDFNSWEYSQCLTMVELLTFKPHTSKIYKWIIDPMKYGLPNNDGSQMIICKYYFGLKDTIFIEAPQFLGGEINVGFFKSNSDSVENLKNNLNVVTIRHSGYSSSISEEWQFEGYQIDSLISILTKDDNIQYAEKSVFVEYESIENEKPLEFYPLHINDVWKYLVEKKYEDTLQDTSYYLTVRVRGTDTLSKKRYYTIANSDNYCLNYCRIDSNNATVWMYNTNSYSDCMIDNLSMHMGNGFNSCERIVQCLGVTYPNIFGTKRLTKIFESMPAITCMYVPRTKYKYAQGIGKIYSLTESPTPTGTNTIKQTLVYAKVNGIEYGSSTSTEDENNNFPNRFSLLQNYPNPFNPTTTISYAIPANKKNKMTNVKLVIYDVLGREVVTLVNKEQNVGSYKVIFDASKLNSGVYFYQLQSGNFTESKKMILLK